MNRHFRNFARLVLTLAAVYWGLPASAQQQVPIPGSSIPKFVDPLPIPTIVAAGTEEITINMWEFQASMLPTGFVLPNGTPYSGTWVWGYRPGPKPTTVQPTYVGPVIVANRGTPTQLRYVNNLGTVSSSNLQLYKNATDQTLHWADPLNNGANMCAHSTVPGQPPSADCAAHYTGSIPAVVHLHGGEVPPVLDGGPDAWFTSNGSTRGHGYYSGAGAAANEAIYRYPNSQEAGPSWFHDHTLGLTRLNVNAGLAGAYLIYDPNLALPANLPGLDQVVPLVIQDRSFDTNGQLMIPVAGLNPEHPYWVPEFVGDTIVVNGKAWPFLNVQAKRYRFLIINGSNARTYELSLNNPSTGVTGPSLWQIATDGGYLDAPIQIGPGASGRMQKLTLMPGERADVVIDFAGLQGKKLILRNTARTPFPKGGPPNGSTVGQVLQFRVQPGVINDTSYNPATGVPLRPAGKQIVRLVNPATGTLAPGVAVNKVRQLTLNEVMGPATVVNGIAYPGGPLEILINNTKWDGKRADGTTRGDFTPISLGGMTTYYSETPQEGDTEIWEIVNLTADAHPIHTHLTQFQVLNRQGFSNTYNTAYNASFPGAVFLPGYGPPLDYNLGNSRALGGNPDITPHLQNTPAPPAPNEAGWKDTVITYPGQVTRIAVRFAPTDKPLAATDMFYPFDPNALGYGYAWHCHIIDHEDNEMMRPSIVRPNPAASRSFYLGTDY